MRSNATVSVQVVNQMVKRQMIGEIGGGVWDEYLVRTNNANYESSVIEVITVNNPRDFCAI